jgi:hypothetical protein
VIYLALNALKEEMDFVQNVVNLIQSNTIC